MKYNEYAYKTEKTRKSIFTFANELAFLMFEECQNIDSIEEMRNYINKSVDRYIKLLSVEIE